MARRRTTPPVVEPVASPPTSTPWVPLWPLSPPPTLAYGTSLPASPVDGQEAILVDSVTAPTYQWRFRYNAASTSPYKWEYIGGAPMRHEMAASQSISGSAYVNAPTPGPTLVVPLAGEYLVEYGARGAGYGQNDVGWMSPSFNGGTPIDSDAAHCRSYAAGGDGNGPHGGKTFTLAAAVNITMRYRCFAGPVTFGPDRYLSLTPRRVS